MQKGKENEEVEVIQRHPKIVTYEERKGKKKQGNHKGKDNGFA